MFKYLKIRNCVAPLATNIPELKNDKILFCHECFVIVVTMIPLGVTPVTTGMRHCAVPPKSLNRKEHLQPHTTQSVAVSCGESTCYTETHLMNTGCTCSQVRTCTVSTEGNKVNHDLIPHTHTHSVPCSLYYLRPHWCTQCSLLPRRHVITFV